MNPDLPDDARQIVAAYTAHLEWQYTNDEPAPASVARLPYPKQTIKQAIRTVAITLASSDQLTGDLRPLLETAYTALADYADDEVVRLITEYRETMADLATEAGQGRERMASDAWRRLVDTSPLVADIARTLADEAEALRVEFDTFAGAPVRPF